MLQASGNSSKTSLLKSTVILHNQLSTKVRFDIVTSGGWFSKVYFITKVWSPQCRWYFNGDFSKARLILDVFNFIVEFIVKESLIMPQQSSYKSSSSAMSSFMCCTSERSSKTFAYKESQSKFLWLDPTRWVEKRSKKSEVGGLFSAVCLQYFGFTNILTCN